GDRAGRTRAALPVLRAVGGDGASAPPAVRAGRVAGLRRDEDAAVERRAPLARRVARGDRGDPRDRGADVVAAATEGRDAPALTLSPGLGNTAGRHRPQGAP